MSKEWREDKALVLSEIKRLSKSNSDLASKMDKRDEKIMNALQDIKLEVNSFKIRFTIWGGIGGFISLIIVGVVQEIFTKFLK